MEFFSWDGMSIDLHENCVNFKINGGAVVSNHECASKN